MSKRHCFYSYSTSSIYFWTSPIADCCRHALPWLCCGWYSELNRAFWPSETKNDSIASGRFIPSRVRSLAPFSLPAPQLAHNLFFIVTHLASLVLWPTLNRWIVQCSSKLSCHLHSLICNWIESNRLTHIHRRNCTSDPWATFQPELESTLVPWCVQSAHCKTTASVQ